MYDVIDQEQEGRFQEYDGSGCTPERDHTGNSKWYEPVRDPFPPYPNGGYRKFIIWRCAGSVGARGRGYVNTPLYLLMPAIGGVRATLPLKGLLRRSTPAYLPLRDDPS